MNVQSEELLRLASQAGLQISVYSETYPTITRQLAKFAELVGAAEREACAKVCEGIRREHDRVASDYWEFFLPTECEDAASRSAGECADAIRRLAEKPARPLAAET
ncbi:MAG: hypothetical protein K0R03_699 [Moraxellaceae bacterium]|jgi:hypothetical protein|nr:hypothetical protein [Moraxellaceae bacterium]MDF3030141.1 hypothetical protein [Moraxellaceae bacterium]